jgi:hypothetical protein
MMHASSYTGATFAASGGPWYLPLAGNMPGDTTGAGQVGYATEAYAVTTIQRPTVFSSLRMATRTVGASTTARARLRINGAYGHTDLTLNASNTFFTDSVNTDMLLPGDRVCLEVTVTGVNTVACDSFAWLGQPLMRQRQLPHWLMLTPSLGPSGTAVAAGGADGYSPLFGEGAVGSATESSWQITMRKRIVIGLYELYAPTNTSTGTSVVRSRKNGANANSLVSFAATETGRKIDDRFDEYVPGDTGDFVGSFAGTGSFTFANGAMTGFGWWRPYTIVLRAVSGTGIVFNKNQMMPLEGICHPASLVGVASGGLNAHAPLVPYQFACLQVKPITNTLNGNTTITLANQTVDTAITVTIPASSTTIVEDQTHTYDLPTPATDYLNHHINTTAPSSGSATFLVTIWGRPLYPVPPWGMGPH